MLTAELLADLEAALGVPLKSYSWLDRKQAVTVLAVVGFPVAYSTLETRVSRPTRDGSPPFRKFNNKVLYRLSELIDWAADRAVYRPASPRRLQARSKSSSPSTVAA